MSVILEPHRSKWPNESSSIAIEYFKATGSTLACLHFISDALSRLDYIGAILDDEAGGRRGLALTVDT